MGDLLRDCNLTTTSFNPSATSASVTGISGTPSLTTPAATNAQSTDPSQTTSTITNVPGLPTSSDGVAQQTENGAAPVPTLAAMGVGLGALGFAMGML
jgi:hypothetical protein